VIVSAETGSLAEIPRLPCRQATTGRLPVDVNGVPPVDLRSDSGAPKAWLDDYRPGLGLLSTAPLTPPYFARQLK
jgi:hypothetical protein